MVNTRIFAIHLATEGKPFSSRGIRSVGVVDFETREATKIVVGERQMEAFENLLDFLDRGQKITLAAYNGIKLHFNNTQYVLLK